MKEIKLRKLEESLESGLISKEEYEKKKKEIKDMPEGKIEAKEEKVSETKIKSDKTLIVGVIIIVLLFVTIFGLIYLIKERPETIDELHELNLKGKLKDEQGYLYKDIYSFVKFDGLWYTQMMSPKGTRFYNIQFRYGPREVEAIKIYGSLNTELFNDAAEYYVTFNPTGNYFSGVALAVGDFNTHMTKVFFKKPIAACDKNETNACKDRPIITCKNTDKVVLYIKEANNTRVYYDDNCIMVEGSGLELVKGVDRVLYDFYKIIE
jgi:hypothetical protein|tara:strand:+ start:17332 stop:18126 length:795 start_codon:yes stop_codon:yes gene_type:complete